MLNPLLLKKKPGKKKKYSCFDRTLEMSNKNYIINESITETQQVQFIIDKSHSLEKLKDVDLSKFQKAIIFCDSKIEDTWWQKIEKILHKKINFSQVFFIEASEQTKSVKNYIKLVSDLEKNRCSRDDIIIAIGGGTILDAISYLASTYMRGISLFMIPTTLIGQADASTAGKTCINTQYAKNVLGTLFLPKVVYNNVSILNTVIDYEMRQGFSEIFKYGLLGSQYLLDLLIDYNKSHTSNLMMEILKETIRVRIDVRKKDPLASNLGHTFGHALEKVTNYSVNHGDAISVGTVMALEFAASKNIVNNKFKNETINLMNSLGLNTKISSDIEIDKLTKTMLTDKKSSNTHIRLVLIEKTAKPYKIDGDYYYPVLPKEMEKFLQLFMQNENYINENHWEVLKRK